MADHIAVYNSAFSESVSDPTSFWAPAAKEISWTHAPLRVLDDEHVPYYRWFPDGELNTCFNALDRHVEGGRGQQVALIYDSPVTGTVRSYTYEQLRDDVARFAGGLQSLGVHRGERVVIYMPMVPEAIIAMLACARLGAIHSVVFGGFAANELAARIDDARPKVVISASCGIEVNRVIEYKPMLERAIQLASHRPEHCVILARPQCQATMTEIDVDWGDLMDRATPVGCVPLSSADPLYVLYTSGTTGRPRGVVRDNGGYAVALQWSMANIYDARPGDVFWAASDIGWVVGHSYIVYGPLLAGCTTVLYEGKPVGTPDAGAFWRVVGDHQVNVLFTAPTALRAIRKEDPSGLMAKRYDLSSLRTLFVAGERLDPDTLGWAERTLGVPVIDHWWQTETGWPIAANLRGLAPMAVKPGSPSVPVPGYDVQVLDEEGNRSKAGVEGAIAIRLPLPPGTLLTIWNDDRSYVDSYLARYPGYYLTGDGGHFDDDGYLFVMGRIDDVINVAAHRLSTGSIEEVISGHPDVAECAVIGVADEIKGQVPWGFVVLKAGVERDHDEVRTEIVQRVRTEIGAIASLQRVDIISALPKTRSGKILRGAMRAIADGRDEPVPATIDDPTALEAMRLILAPGTR